MHQRVILSHDDRMAGVLPPWRRATGLWEWARVPGCEMKHMCICLAASARTGTSTTADQINQIASAGAGAASATEKLEVMSWKCVNQARANCRMARVPACPPARLQQLVHSRRADLLGESGELQLRLIGFVNERMQGVPLRTPPHAETVLSLVERRPHTIEDSLR